MKRKTISIGVICFNEEYNVIPAYNDLARIAKKEQKYIFEFIFVDNGSIDKTRIKIKEIIKKDRRVSGVFLSRNFGPESSGQAALDFASGDAFVMYEGDMQDPPDVIFDFIKQWEKGFEVVVGIREKIDDIFPMTIIRKLYYKVFKAISNIEVPINAGSFSLLDKRVVNVMKKLPEKYRFFRGLRAWVGFKTSYVSYKRRKRQRGKSSYNLFRYLNLAERSFFGFSYLPLDLIVYLGLLSVLLSLIWLVLFLFSFVIYGQTLKDSTLILFLVILFGGIQLLASSIIGKYIQVITEETKGRPAYIVEKILKR